MRADLYIIPESFLNNNQYTNAQIEGKVKYLAADIININRHNTENKLYANYVTVYPLIFHSTYTVEDFLCRPLEVKKNVDRDVVNAFQNIFQRAVDTTLSSAEIIETLLPWHDENICHGIIAFHKVENINEEVQLIYGIDGWFKFRRHFLGLYPNSDSFISECSKYFKHLYFHERNVDTVRAILNGFSITIVNHLGYLNDVLYDYRRRTFENETVKYQTLTSECKLQEAAASKDSHDSKDNLTFEFPDERGTTESITCYPHLRICRSDGFPGDGHYYHHRIYFHEGIAAIKGGKILIGHIGVHL